MTSQSGTARGAHRAAEYVEGSDKLLKLTLDLGELGARQVFAGIRSAYDPAALVGRLTVVVANLAPRKMRFGVSQGMVLAASGEKPGIFLLSPDCGRRAWHTEGDNERQGHRCAVAADAMHALRLSRAACPYAQAIARGARRSTSARRAGPPRSRRSRRALGREALPLNPQQRRRRPAARRADRRSALHRLLEVPAALPGGCHHRREAAHCTPSSLNCAPAVSCALRRVPVDCISMVPRAALPGLGPSTGAERQPRNASSAHTARLARRVAEHAALLAAAEACSPRAVEPFSAPAGGQSAPDDGACCTSSPFELLIAVMLSAHTTDRSVNARDTQALCSRQYAARPCAHWASRA